MNTKHIRTVSRLVFVVCVLIGVAAAQSCFTAADLDASTRGSIERAAQQYLLLAQRGDYAGLRSAAIPSLASNFSPIEGAIGEHQKDLQGQGTSSGVYVLDASSSTGTIQRAEFYCGIFNSPDRVGFVIPNLPAGKYAVVTEAVSGGKTPVNVNFILQASGTNWQLGGLTINPQTVNGHDSNWFATQARSYHQSGANMAAYLYYWMAWKLAVPTEIQYTAARDKIADEMQAAKPANFPTNDAPLSVTANGKTYRVRTLFPEAVGTDLDIIVKYQALSDLSNTAAAFADNTAAIKALLAQFPELRTAFGGVVARAVAPNGSDYGTMLAMKDVK
jgi:hypothetical protein